MLATTPATGHQRRLERSLRRRRRRKNAHWSDRVATTAVTMQRRLSASWAEAKPRSPQGSLNAPSEVGQFAPVRLGREDARPCECALLPAVLHPTHDPPVLRAGLLHAVGSSRRCGVVIALESGEFSIPDRPHVCLRVDTRAAGVPNRSLGGHQGYHLVVLGDELSWLERRVVESRCKTTKPA